MQVGPFTARLHMLIRPAEEGEVIGRRWPRRFCRLEMRADGKRDEQRRGRRQQGGESSRKHTHLIFDLHVIGKPKER